MAASEFINNARKLLIDAIGLPEQLLYDPLFIENTESIYSNTTVKDFFDMVDKIGLDYPIYTGNKKFYTISKIDDNYRIDVTNSDAASDFSAIDIMVTNNDQHKEYKFMGTYFSDPTEYASIWNTQVIITYEVSEREIINRIYQLTAPNTSVSKTQAYLLDKLNDIMYVIYHLLLIKNNEIISNNIVKNKI